MNTFEVISIYPLSDQPSPREIAKQRVQAYRQKRLDYVQEPPPIGSLRRVFWAASKSERRSIVQRVLNHFR